MHHVLHEAVGMKEQFVENEVIVEIKSIDRFERVHTAQLLTYLRLADRRVGLLINFNVKLLMRDGFKRLVYNFPD